MAQTRKSAAVAAGKQNIIQTRASMATKQTTLGRARSRRRLRLTGATLKRVAMILLVFMIAMAFINQYSRIISVGGQINAMEKEIKSTQMLTDRLEAQVISMVNWDQIEYVAKTKLNMVEPTQACYTAMELKPLPQEYTQEKANIAQGEGGTNTVTEKISSVFSWLTD